MTADLLFTWNKNIGTFPSRIAEKMSSYRERMIREP